MARVEIESAFRLSLSSSRNFLPFYFNSVSNKTAVDHRCHCLQANLGWKSVLLFRFEHAPLGCAMLKELLLRKELPLRRTGKLACLLRSLNSHSPQQRP